MKPRAPHAYKEGHGVLAGSGKLPACIAVHSCFPPCPSLPSSSTSLHPHPSLFRAECTSGAAEAAGVVHERERRLICVICVICVICEIMHIFFIFFGGIAVAHSVTQ